MNVQTVVTRGVIRTTRKVVFPYGRFWRQEWLDPKNASISAMLSPSPNALVVVAVTSVVNVSVAAYCVKVDITVIVLLGRLM